MHNPSLYTFSVCGKTVESLWQQHGTTRVQSSTPMYITHYLPTRLWVQQRLIPVLIPRFPLLLSTMKIVLSPLEKRQLSSVSTAPITRATKMKFKKGI